MGIIIVQSTSRRVHAASNNTAVPWRLHLLLALLVVAVGCNRTNNSTGKKDLSDVSFDVATTEHQSAHIDEDYRFRIDSLGQQWRIMDEEEIRKILPDAVAGAVRVKSTYAAVIVEPLGDSDVVSYAELVRTTLTDALQDCSSGPMKELEFEGAPATRFSTTGLVNGVRIAYEHVLFVHQRFGYQLITWSLKPDESFSEEFFDAFHVLDGEIRPRLVSSATADAEAVGYRVRDGRFESSVFRIKLEPPEGWRLLVGPELLQVNAEAIVGLASTDSMGYMVAIPEYVTNVDFPTLHQTLRSGFRDSVEANFGIASQPDPIEIDVFGTSVSFDRLRTSSTPAFEYYYGVYGVDKLNIQLMAWTVEPNEEQVQKRLSPVLASMELTSEEETAALRKEELSRPDVQNNVGPQYSLRRGVYRNFEAGAVWKRPAGFWKVSTGDQARSANPIADMYCQDLLTGVNLMLVCEDLGGDPLDPKVYHSAVLENVFPSDSPAHTSDPKPVTIDGQGGLASEYETEFDGTAFRYRVTTTLRNGWAYQMLAWAFPDNMGRAKKDVDAAIAGFSFPESKLEPMKLSPAQFRDLRMGLQLDLPGGGWNPLDVTPPQISPIGALTQYRRGTTELIIGGVTLPTGSAADTGFLDGLMAGMMDSNLQKFVDTPPIESDIKLGSISARQRAWVDGNDSFYYVTGIRDSTIVLMILIDRSGKGPATLPSITRGFQFLD